WSSDVCSSDLDVRVIGCALAARAAIGLEDGAGIPSVTLDRLLADLDRRHRAYRLPANGVVVVDEAGMVGTRKLAALLDHAEQARAKVVLVGDHYQLPEIDDGHLSHGCAVTAHKAQGATVDQAWVLGSDGAYRE